MPTLRESFDFLLVGGPVLFPDTRSMLYVGHRSDTDPWWWRTFAPALGIERIAVLDIDEMNLRTASHITDELYLGDLRDIDLPRFDLIFWDEGPEHLPREESLMACRSFMERNGALLVSCPWGLQLQGTDPRHPEFHHWGPTPEDFGSIGMEAKTFGTMFVPQETRSLGHGNLIGWGSSVSDGTHHVPSE